MKVCAKCGVEIDGLDGDNLCPDCANEQRRSKKQNIETYDLAGAAKLAKRRAERKERDSIMRSVGLVKVKGACGGVYWE